MSTLNGHRVSSAVARRFRHGVWSAVVQLVDPVALAGAVVFTVGDLTLAGSVVLGGPDAATSSAAYTITGGAGGWRRQIPARPEYRNDLGVKLSTVLRHDALAAKEQIEIDPALDRVLGTAFVRRAGLGWAVLGLARLALPWWMDDAGVTQVRARPAPLVTASYRVIRPLLEQGMREIATETPSLFAPGALFLGAPIEQVTIHVDHAALRLQVRS